MRVPAHIRFTLAELTAYGLQSAEVLARANSAIHLVLREHQTTLPTPEMDAACSIISVEDTDGITLAVLKHPEGKAWDRRHEAVVYTPEITGTVRLDVPGRDPNYMAKGVRSDPEPVVPRRDPPQAAPAGEDRFQRGLDAMDAVLFQSHQGGNLKGYGSRCDSLRPGPDITLVDGQISLRALARAFLDAYQPQITISDQFRFALGKRAMKAVLYRAAVDGTLLVGPMHDGQPEHQIDDWSDLINAEGVLDIDALAKAAWSVMKEGQGR